MRNILGFFVVFFFFLFLHENMLWVHIRSAFQMSTHNICVCKEIRKISILFGKKKSALEVFGHFNHVYYN